MSASTCLFRYLLMSRSAILQMHASVYNSLKKEVTLASKGLISSRSPIQSIHSSLFPGLPPGSSRPPPSLSAPFVGSVVLPTERFGQTERGSGVWHVDQCLWSLWGLQSSLFHLINTVLTLWSHTQQRNKCTWGSGEVHGVVVGGGGSDFLLWRFDGTKRCNLERTVLIKNINKTLSKRETNSKNVKS